MIKYPICFLLAILFAACNPDRKKSTPAVLRSLETIDVTDLWNKSGLSASLAIICWPVFLTLRCSLSGRKHRPIEQTQLKTRYGKGGSVPY
jgi:hypothetical protein